MTLFLDKGSNIWHFDLENSTLLTELTLLSEGINDVVDYTVLWDKGMIPRIIVKDSKGRLSIYYRKGGFWRLLPLHETSGVEGFAAAFFSSEYHIVASQASCLLHIKVKGDKYRISKMPPASYGYEVIAMEGPVLKLLCVDKNHLDLWIYDGNWSYAERLLAIPGYELKKYFKINRDSWGLLTTNVKNGLSNLSFFLFHGKSLIIQSTICKAKNLPLEKPPVVLQGEVGLAVLFLKERELFLFISDDNGHTWKMDLHRKLSFNLALTEVVHNNKQISNYIAIKKIKGEKLVTPFIMSLPRFINILKDHTDP